VPNGRTLDYRALNPYGTRAGVMKQSYVDVLYTAGLATGFYAPAGADPDADIEAWRTRLLAGEPYDDDPLLLHAVEELTSHHSGYYIDDSIPPAPLLIYDAFTDDIMPPVQALRFYNKTKSLHPGTEVALQFLDGFAHPRGLLASPQRTITYDRVTQHLVRHLSGAGTSVPPVEVYTQACNGSAQAGPFTAADWASLRPGEVRLADAGPKNFDSAGGDAVTAAADDPVGAMVALACRTLPTSADDPMAATYRVPAAPCTYTLVGSPTVIADLSVDGEFAQVAARLWDVAPGGSQSLVTHGLYRPRLDDVGPQAFQLEPAGWQFTAGHVAKLELLGQSAPYGRPSNGAFTITASNVELRLPTLETPGTCGAQAPAAPVLPPSAPEGTTTTTVIGSTTTPPPHAAALGADGSRQAPGRAQPEPARPAAHRRARQGAQYGQRDPREPGRERRLAADHRQRHVELDADIQPPGRRLAEERPGRLPLLELVRRRGDPERRASAGRRTACSSCAWSRPGGRARSTFYRPISGRMGGSSSPSTASTATASASGGRPAGSSGRTTPRCGR
jgi:hypothetical protein